MADVEDKVAGTVKLQVAAARQEESGQGIARLPRSTLAALGITEGDVIEIEGKRATPARAVLAYPEDEGLEVIRLDGLQRANAEVGSGDHVQVRKIESRPATRVVFAPAQKEMRLNGPADLRKALMRRPEQFVQTLTEKLMTYALGRSVEYYDMPVVRAIVRDAARDNYRFSSIVMGIVRSAPFQMRKASEEGLSLKP